MDKAAPGEKGGGRICLVSHPELMLSMLFKYAMDNC